jgi:hypothetical protein
MSLLVPLHVPVTRPQSDAPIAATALVHGITVVTRNVRDFEGRGVKVTCPWGEAGTGVLKRTYATKYLNDANEVFSLQEARFMQS